MTASSIVSDAMPRSKSYEWRGWDALTRRAVGDGERADAISFAVCTSEARVAAGWPYKDEKDSVGECMSADE